MTWHLCTKYTLYWDWIDLPMYTEELIRPHVGRLPMYTVLLNWDWRAEDLMTSSIELTFAQPHCNSLTTRPTSRHSRYVFLTWKCQAVLPLLSWCNARAWHRITREQLLNENVALLPFLSCSHFRRRHNTWPQHRLYWTEGTQSERNVTHDTYDIKWNAIGEIFLECNALSNLEQ